MIRLKTLLAEQGPTNRKGIPQDVMDASPGNSDRPYNPPSNASNLEIHVNHINVDLNYSNLTLYKTGKLDSEFVDETIRDIEAHIEDENIRDPETGQLTHDITRMVSDLEFDCEIKIGKDTIDLRVIYDAEGDIQDVDIQDTDLAEKHGVTETDVYDYLISQ